MQNTPRLLLPKTLQVLRHLARKREVLGVEAFDLLDARPGILGEIEDVDLAVRENDPHADRRVTQTIDAAFRLRDGIVFEPSLVHQVIELALEDPRRCCSVGILGQEKIVLTASVGIAVFDALIS
jgi:hypothetical protein